LGIKENSLNAPKGCGRRMPWPVEQNRTNLG
jgi:hypothetical protein